MVAEHLIQNDADLAACCEKLAACERIGLDTEFVGEDTFHPHLCLIQTATPEALYLIDPFAVSTLAPFWTLITDPQRETVVHAGREEVRLCQLASGQAPGKLFDLQIAAGLAGLNYPMSHASLVSEVLRIQLTKGETLTEWRGRPLTPAQIGYAFDDVRHLLAARAAIGERLRKLEHESWAVEEFDRLRALALPVTGDSQSERWRKLRGLGTLNRRQLAVAREVFSWREQLAAQENRPPRVLLRDDLIIEVARRNPKSDRDIKVMRGVARRHATGIMQALERARAVPPADCPALTERDQDPPQVAVVVSVLSAVLADCCSRLQVAPGLVTSNSDLKRLVRARLHKEQPPADSLLTQGWRGRHVLPELLAVLDGQRALFISDLTRETPFDYVPR